MIEFLLDAPASVKILVSFAGILLAGNAGLGLGVSILLFSALLSLWSGTGIVGLGHVASTYLSPDNVMLLLVIVLLMLFTEGLGKTGRMARSIDAIKAFFRSRSLILAGPPALIGLLPMPGGALFSAPFVGHADPSGAVSAVQKTAINYWFRHIWEYWWPLYPGVILAMQYSGLPVGLYMFYLAPFTLVTVVMGYLFILRPVTGQLPLPGETGRRPGDIVKGLAPILVIVGCAIAGASTLGAVGMSGTRANLVSTLAGIFIASVWIFRSDRGALLTTLTLLKKRSLWTLVFLIVGILAFSAALKTPVNAEGATLVSLMRDEFVRIGMPIIPLIVAVAFISGAVTGIAMGFVGASFPLIFALLGDHPSMNQVVATTILAYGSGYAGMMLTPMHTCFTVTGQYFGASIYRAYRYLIGPVVVTWLFSLALAGLWYVVL